MTAQKDGRLSLKKRVVYDVLVEGEPLRMEPVSTWHGFIELRAPDGSMLIVATNPKASFGELFEEILGTAPKITEVTVISGSPELLEKLGLIPVEGGVR